MSGAFDTAVLGLVLAVTLAVCFAAEYVRGLRQHARRPWLPYEDRPPAGVRPIRGTSDVAVIREADRGLAAMISLLRRRGLSS